MSVSMSRFVNVMTGGQYGKGWTDKPMHRKDARIAAILNAIDAELATLTPLGADQPWRDARDDVERAMSMTDGRTGDKLLRHLDDAAKRGAKVLADVKAQVPVAQARVSERKAAIDAVRPRMVPAEFVKMLPYLQSGDRDPARQLFDALSDSFVACCTSTEYSAAQQELVMSELRDIAVHMEAISRASVTQLSIGITVKVAKSMDAEGKDPNGEFAQIAGTITQSVAQGMLEKLEVLKGKHGVDFRPLEPADQLAVQIYTSANAYYGKMHALLLGKIPEDPIVRAQIDGCQRAMAKLPNYPAPPTFRFEDGSKYKWQAQFSAGKTFAIKIFWSSGRTGGVAASGMTKGGVELHITIFGKSGKDVGKMSAVQGEGGGEILFPPGTKFRTIELDDGELRTPPPAGKNPKVLVTVQEVS